jgi:dTDP-D-glucose 4,6-dehydratase
VCLDNLTLAQRIAAVTGEPLLVHMVDFHAHNPAHDMHYGLEDNKLRSAGWCEPLGFDAGLRQTIAWERAQR